MLVPDGARESEVIPENTWFNFWSTRIKVDYFEPDHKSDEMVSRITQSPGFLHTPAHSEACFARGVEPDINFQLQSFI